MERIEFLNKIESKGNDKIRELLNYANYLRQADPDESIIIAKEALKLSEETKYKAGITGAIIHIAYANLYKSNFDDVEIWANELIKIGVKDKIPNVIGTAYNMKARIAHKLDDPAKAISLLLKALDYYVEADNKIDLMTCYNNLGMVHLRLNEKEEAELYLKLALQMAEKTNS
mgnify:CR=1 FL=1